MLRSIPLLMTELQHSRRLLSGVAMVLTDLLAGSCQTSDCWPAAMRRSQFSERLVVKQVGRRKLGVMHLLYCACIAILANSL
jgi:hypothetical protein